MDQIPVNSIVGGGGNSWPPALRRRLGLPSTSCSSTSKSSKNDELSTNIDKLPTTQSSVTHTTSTLSSHELRQYIHKTYSTLTSIQRQLHRGEESYFEQTYSHGNLLQGWDNIWIEQHHNHHNSNSYTSYTNSSSGMYSSSGGGMGEDGTSSNSINNHAHHMNNHNKSIPIRKMPADYRWFTSSCGTNLPVTSTDNNNDNSSDSSGRVAALERWSLIDRPSTPEVQEEKQVANEEVDGSLIKKEANVAVTSIVDKRAEKDIGSGSNNDNTAQSTKDTVVAAKVESNMAATMATESHHANGKEADTAADQIMDIDLMHQSKKLVVKEAENQSNKGQPSKVADTEPQSYHTLSSAGQSSTDTEMVIEKMASSSTLEFTTRKDETNDTARLPDASSSSNIQSSSDVSSSPPTAAAAADDVKYQTNTATVQSNKQTETTSSNDKNSTDNTSMTVDRPKNSNSNEDSYETTGRATVGKDTSQEQDSSTSISLPQSKRARLDTNQLPKDDGSTAVDDTTSSKADMNANLSKELVHDQETIIKVKQSEPTEEEEKAETVPTSSTAVIDGSRASSSRRSTRKRKTTS